MEQGWYPSATYAIPSSCGRFYVTLVYNVEQTKLIRILASAGKAGGCAWTHLHSFAQRITFLLEKATFAERVEEYVQMEASTCHQPDCCLALSARVVKRVEMNLFERGEDNE
jgi:hypothetical protein